ncbi:MAG TPA: hypothetical protein VFB45_27805 [Pseudolabrys sp.]|nr:hypothetical protein [Pseudolabrys sp.]
MTDSILQRAISLLAAALACALAFGMQLGSAQAAVFGMQPYYAVKLALEPFGSAGAPLQMQRTDAIVELTQAASVSSMSLLL